MILFGKMKFFFQRAQMQFIELHPHIKYPEEVILQIEKENINFKAVE